MRIAKIFKRILLSSAVIASVLLPGFTTLNVSAAHAMGDMGYAQADLVNCFQRHQTPVAPIDKHALRQDDENKDDPIPHETPYFIVFQKNLGEGNRPKPSLIESSSFVPPDIVILTATYRI